MDSLSQIVLGAAVGELTLGKKIGNRAQLIGAIAGTIPDLDIFLSIFYNSEIDKLQIHRGYSHSMFFHLLLAVPFTWLTYIIFKKKISFGRWYVLWYLGFFTHALLDCCTTYGTMLFLPFTDFLVGFNNISVIDPLWTIPFMILLIVCLFMRRENPKRYRMAVIATSYSLLYMGITFVNKYVVHRHFAEELSRQEIKVDNLYTSPSIFNNILWAGIGTTQDSIYLGEYSLIQERPSVKWVRYPRHLELIANHPAKHEFEVLTWFAQGKYFAEQEADTTRFYNVKWGRSDFTKTTASESILFYFEVYPENGVWIARQKEEEFDINQAWNALWRRVRTADDF